MLERHELFALSSFIRFLHLLCEPTFGVLDLLEEVVIFGGMFQMHLQTEREVKQPRPL